VADLLLNFPASLATHTATELAREAGTSKAAVSRLIHRLGYGSYAAARSEARKRRQWGAPIDQDVPGSGQEDYGFDRHVNADMEVLRQTLESVRREDLDSLVEAMAEARRIVIIGHRNSALLANFLRGHLALLRDGVELAPMHGATLAEGLVGIGPRDLLIAVGFRRRVPAFATALEVARRTRTPTAVLTDPTGGALAGPVRWTLAAHCRGASIFDSYVAAVSLVNYLAERLVRHLGADARARLREIERLHGELGDLI
jgi:DNA-binding MurR/RpiR family transcriptional regulator